ncbi:unnamed protein product, partial [Didymodactylos carnosus]
APEQKCASCRMLDKEDALYAKTLFIHIRERKKAEGRRACFMYRILSVKLARDAKTAYAVHDISARLKTLTPSLPTNIQETHELLLQQVTGDSLDADEEDPKAIQHVSVDTLDYENIDSQYHKQKFRDQAGHTVPTKKHKGMDTIEDPLR